MLKVDFEQKGDKFQGFVRIGSNAVDGLKGMFKWKHAKLFQKFSEEIFFQKFIFVVLQNS